QVQDQLDALPPAGLEAWHELRATLELAPGDGRSLFAAVPDGLRTFVFGADGEGLAYYLTVVWLTRPRRFRRTATLRQ
ncbi:MAG: hypothetical protein ACRDRN_21530, partial [Sciscionella sp.]